VPSRRRRSVILIRVLLHPAGADARLTAVPHIRQIEVDEATGMLADEYAAAIERAGKVFNIVKAMCLNPTVLNRSLELYKAIMFGPSELSRAERELLATVVSTANGCHY
jgi:alkylhydroperoxidase family enzyme